MRRLLLAAVAAAAIATPAVARDNSWYVGVEGGVMLVEDLQLDYGDNTLVSPLDDAIVIDHKLGYDVDLIGGYDFGMFRVEAETAYKRASLGDISIPDTLTNDPTGVYDGSGRVQILSAMANVLLDFGDDDGWNGYVGGGIGAARIKYRAVADQVDLGFSDTDKGIALQAIAGVRYAISPNMDLGIKYRFFTTRAEFRGNDGANDFGLDGRIRTHSLLASLIFNFAPPPVILPPPPPPRRRLRRPRRRRRARTVR